MDPAHLLLTFIPLFVAMDVVGVLPLYLGVTAGVAEIDRRHIVAEATITAAPSGPARSRRSRTCSWPPSR